MHLHRKCFVLTILFKCSLPQMLHLYEQRRCPIVPNLLFENTESKLFTIESLPTRFNRYKPFRIWDHSRILIISWPFVFSDSFLQGNSEPIDNTISKLTLVIALPWCYFVFVWFFQLLLNWPEPMFSYEIVFLLLSSITETFVFCPFIDYKIYLVFDSCHYQNVYFCSIDGTQQIINK